MTIEVQAILCGHLAAQTVSEILQNEILGTVSIRNMQRPEYKILEVNRPDGTVSALHLFLDSWAGEDYRDVFSGQSTFATMEYTPQNYSILLAVATVTGGLVRKSSTDSWVTLEPAPL